LFRPIGIRVTDPAPTAWDHFFRDGLACHIVFHLKSKDIIGAAYGKDSFATTYPDIQEIYVEELWVIDPVTRAFIKPANNTKGAIIKLAWIIHEHFCLISSATSSCTFILLGR